jgi:hypothetical protein
VTAQTQREEAGSPELIVRGTARLFPIEVRDPHFKYVRWCSDFEIVESGTGRVLGAIAHGGREGHLTEREATAKALRVIRQELSSEVAKAIAAHIFGEIALPEPDSMPASCPQEGSETNEK